jgi:hypothetical protein
MTSQTFRALLTPLRRLFSHRIGKIARGAELVIIGSLRNQRLKDDLMAFHEQFET